MKRYHPESSLTAEEKLKRVAATVGLAMPKEDKLVASVKQNEKVS